MRATKNISSQILEKHFPFPFIDAKRVAEELILITREQFRQANFRKAVLGLSGGIDSALSLAICSEALGNKNILALRLPYKTTSPLSLQHAELLTTHFNITSETIDITPMCDAYFSCAPNINRTRAGNVMARMRMIVLYDFSAQHNALVVGSSNRSEILLGYSTLWGDSAYAYNPLASLYKTHVRALANYFSLPAEIINKPPSADLWEGQTDEEDLEMSYNLADRILYYSIDRQWDNATMAQKLTACELSPEIHERVLSRVEKFSFKREMPRLAQIKVF